MAQASKFWDDFYVNFGDWNVNYRNDNADSGNIVVNLGLDNTSGNLHPYNCIAPGNWKQLLNLDTKSIQDVTTFLLKLSN